MLTINKMAEIEKLSLIQILAIKIKKMVGAQIIKRWHCQLGQYQVFSRQKKHVDWFYKLNENSITDSNQEPIGSCPNLNHKILFFSASLSTLKAIQHELNKNSPLSRRNFRELNSLKILRSYSVPSKCFRSFAVRKMYLHLRRFNISKNKQSTLT